MFSSENINEIHRALQKKYAKGLVLLGGSYLHGEADEKSDVDFYVVAGMSDFLNYLSDKKGALEIKNNYGKNVNITFLPKIFFKRGWNYIYGKDAGGKEYVSGIDKKIIFRNSLKLAYFHYLKFLLSPVEEKETYFFKSAKMAAAACGRAEKQKPFFRVENLLKNTSCLDIGEQKFIQDILLKKDIKINFENNENSEKLLAIIDKIRDLNKNRLNFYLPNYLIYNIHFIKKGVFSFVFSNPDKTVVKKISYGIKNNDLRELFEEMKKIILPIYII